MAFTNHETKEINCKIIYFGPSGSGKTENLRSILRLTLPEAKSGVFSLQPKDESSVFFDFLPVSLGHVKGYHIKLHLFSLSLNSPFETTTTLMLKGLDGYVFVADSRVDYLAENVEALSKMERLLRDQGYNIMDLAKVVQYNKRDVEPRIPLDVLSRELNPSEAADCEAIAVESVGSIETLQSMAKQVLRKLAPVPS